MQSLALHGFHDRLNARFASLNGAEIVADYDDALTEHAALRRTAGVVDLGFRGRLCLTGADRVLFLHGQVTNDIKRLREGEGCYAALVNAKGKMLSDLNVHCLPDELLLDFEPGLVEIISRRLEKYIIADRVELVDVAPLYGLITVQGREAETVVCGLGVFEKIPAREFTFVRATDPALGELYLMNQPRIFPPIEPGGTVKTGFDVFAQTTALESVMERLAAAARSVGGRPCGWRALEMARIEAGIPRFGVDMDESNLPLECGIERRAVNYHKGCYVGQEVINRVHSIGHVTKELRGLRLADNLKKLPVRGDKLLHEDHEVGYISSALASPWIGANIALGYVRRETNLPGTELTLRSGGGRSLAKVVALPFKRR